MRSQMILALLVLLLRSGHCQTPQQDNHICPKREEGSPGAADPSVTDIPPTDIPDMPTLPDQFEVTIEANILTSGWTQVVKEYYDFKKNLGSVHYDGEGKDYHIYYDFDKLQEFEVINGVCTTFDLKKDKPQDSPLEYYITGSKAHVKSMQEMLRWGKKDYKYKYMGMGEVRGIPAHRWETCFKNAKFGNDDKTLYNYALNFFFSEGMAYEGPYGTNVSYPLRVEIDGEVQGEGRHFMHYYDFIGLKAGPISDSSVFSTPRGVHCPGRKNGKRKFPGVDNMFTVYGELVDHNLKSVNQFEEHFDHQMKLNAMTLTHGKDWEQRPVKDMPKVYHNSMTVVDDFNSGFSYFIDNLLKNCTVFPLIKGQATTALLGLGNRIRIKTSMEMLHIDHNYVYVGERIWRGLPVSVWSAMTNATDFHGTTLLVPTEAYFSNSLWRYNAGDQSKKEVLVGQFLKLPEGEKDVNLFGYKSGHSDPNVYDISLCYPKKSQRRRFTLKLKGAHDDLVQEDNLSFLGQALRKAVSQKAGVRPIRITEISFEETTPGYTDAWFTVLDKPPTVPTMIENNEAALGDSSLESVEKLLIGAMDYGKTFELTVYVQDSKDKSIKKTVAVLEGSVRTSEEAVSGSPIVTNVIKKGHSNGSMAGLGIAMLILGAVVGLGVALFLWRRRMEVPYITTN